MPSVIIPTDDVSPSTGTGNQVRSDSPTLVTPTITGKLQTAASTVSSAGLNLPQGTAPTVPVNGDLWTTAAGLYAQINGGTVGPFSAGPGTTTLTGNVTGSGTGTITTTISAGVVTNSMLANVSTATFKGRTTAGSGSPEDLTGTQATALLDTFTSALKGLVPASGGGTTNFLRADGTWAAAGTSFANPTASIGLTAVNGSASTAMRSDAAPALSQDIVPTWTGLHTFSPTIAANTSADGVVLANSAAATAGNQRYSPRLKLSGRGWNSTSSASQSIWVTQEMIPKQTSGTNLDGIFTVKYASNGGTEYPLIAIDTWGNTSNNQYSSIGIGPNVILNGTTGNSQIGIGGAAVCGPNCITIGANASSSGQSRATVIGNGASAGPGNDAIAIGNGTIADGYNCFVAGSSASPINDVFFGKGRTNSTATAYTIFGTGGSGTNNAGANLNLCAGISTGNASPAVVAIRTSYAGASGSSAQSTGTIAAFTTDYLAITPVTQIPANTSSDGLIIENPVSATAGNQNYSPRLRFRGRGWKTDGGGASQTVDAYMEVQPVQGAANPSMLFLMRNSINGAAYSDFFRVDEANSKVAIGVQSTSRNNCILIGKSISNSGDYSVAIGPNVTIGDSYSVAIGAISKAGFFGVAVGQGADCSTGRGIAIGQDAKTTANNQFVAGAPNADKRIASVYFGDGVSSGAPGFYTIFGTGGGGTNIVGGALKLCGGLSTGNATPGTVVIQAGTVGASGSTAQTATDVATFSTTGVTVATSLSDSIGNVRSIPQNAQTSAYIIAATDNGKHISITTGGVTVNASTLTTGQVVVIFNNSSSNQTITQGASVTMYQGGTTNTGNRTLASYGVATILCVGTDTYVITGSGLT